MTARPLDRAFPLRSDQSVRAPADVPEDEQLLELEEEMDRRRRAYPGFVDRNLMTQADAQRHMDIWQALVDDRRRSLALPGAAAWRGNWDGRVRELRRELALRRAAYPKWIASPTNPLTEADARRKMERLDALHYRYWIGLEHFADPAQASAPLADRMRVIRDMVAWQRGLLPLEQLPPGERTFHVTTIPQQPSTPAYWTGRRWARGQRWSGEAGPIGPHQPLDFSPSYFREQEQAA